jgi:glycosyltransferase involved in cell wall biosynthesis
MEHATRSPRPTTWFEVADFVDYFAHRARPSGIQRVQMEVFARVAAYPWWQGKLRFCQFNDQAGRFEAVTFKSLVTAFQGKSQPRRDPLADDPWPPLLPADRPLLARLLLERAKFRNTRRRLYRNVRDGYRHLRKRVAPVEQPFSSGDVLVCLGASWQIPGYPEATALAKDRLGVRIVHLINDLLPVTHPRFFTEALEQRYRHWLAAMLESADLLLTISRYSRSALLAHAAVQRLALPEIVVIPMGSGFRLTQAEQPQAGSQETLPTPCVLCVSTIEPRKNHRLLVRLWQRLIERHGADRIPSLVFCGSLGWLYEDIVSELEATGYLGGKIVVRSNLSDAQLDAAYRGCLFTIFPSLAEGWGLPVAESLERGKICIASGRPAMPEVGGDLADYVDPKDLDGALAAVERVIFDDSYRRAREAEIRARYRPRDWAQCLATVMSAVDRLRQTDHVARVVPDLLAGSTGPSRKIFYWIAHTANFEGNSGIQRVTRNLARCLQAAGEQLVFVNWSREHAAPTRAGDDDLPNLSRWHGPPFRSQSASGQPLHCDDTDRGDLLGSLLLVPEVPYYSAEAENLAGALLDYARRHGMRSAVIFYDLIPITCTGYEPLRLDHELYVKEIARADLILPISRTSGRNLEAYCSDTLKLRATEMPSIIPCPLGEEYLAHDRVRHVTDADSGPIRIVCVGTVEPRKNQLELVRVFNVFCAAHPELDVRLTLAGNIMSAEIKPLEALLKENPRVEFKHHVPDADIAELYRTCHFTVFPSVEEGFGLPIAESLWFGKPCLCANFGSMAELAAGGGCVTIDTRSPAELQRGLENLILDRALRMQVAREAVSRPMRYWQAHAQDVRWALSEASGVPKVC